eukprot:TRINITY_DN4529_c0_g1_i2.p1 TRINITY_DN4529_c0_g1~~TRINITY_DN4529_c0_g1_i2.p1  ORF type:complete len:303 (-),score=17.76 TRINITY_DN4529_c0_g1_i2:198-1106(-)
MVSNLLSVISLGYYKKNRNKVNIDFCKIRLEDYIDDEKGSTSRVKKGYLENGTSVAVKLFVNKAELCPEEMWKREVEINSQLDNPYICKCFGSGTINNTNYIVFELLQCDLSRYIVSIPKRDIPMGKRLSIAKHLCEGMAYLHERGVVHNDLRPENVLLDMRNRPRISDFGYATIKTSNSLTISQCEFEGNGGSALFMSPERLQNEPGDELTDVYSFGLVLWSLVTATEIYSVKPFVDFTRESQYAEIQKAMFKRVICDEVARPPIPAEIQKTYPNLVNIIKACWHPRKRERPTFKDLAKRL